MTQCCNDLAKMKRQFTALLIAVGNNNVNRAKKDKESNLIKLGFSPKVTKIVLTKMLKSGRPPSHYSKTTGLLKKN